MRLVGWPVVVFLFIAALIVRAGEPEDLGCETVLAQTSWTQCETVTKDIAFVTLRGCGGSEGLAYRVRGLKSGKIVFATVCCGTFFKGCTVRSAK